MKNFKTYHLSIDLFRKCKQLKLPYFLKDQILRSSSSVCLNLAEGSGKRTRKDQRRFYQIAFGSLKETRCVFDLAEIKDKSILELADKTAAHLYKLLKALE